MRALALQIMFLVWIRSWMGGRTWRMSMKLQVPARVTFCTRQIPGYILPRIKLNTSPAMDALVVGARTRETRRATLIMNCCCFCRLRMLVRSVALDCTPTAMGSRDMAKSRGRISLLGTIPPY
jgi:hypothetical protein